MDKVPFFAEQLNQLQKICIDEARLLAVFLFGSYVDGYATARSDVDLAILLSEPMTLSERLGLETDFCRALEREDLDIIILSTIFCITTWSIFACLSPIPGASCSNSSRKPIPL